MSNWRKGWKLIVHALNVFRAYPAFVVPIFVVWILYAAGTLYLRYDFPWKQYGFKVDIAVAFAFIFALSFLILMSFAVVLEMIRQSEGGRPSLLRAAAVVVGKDMLSVLPLALVWAIIWLLLTLIEAALSSKNDDSHDDAALTAQHAAETLANFHNFSFSEAFIAALQKGVRMVMFLILPSIIWEHLGFARGVKKGLVVLRAHVGLFGTGYALTYAAAAVAFLPAAIVLALGTGHHGNPPPIHLPSWVWMATIIYVGCAWSLSLYLEQMFMAQLYLWHMRWQEAVAKAKQAGEPAPTFDSVPRPELLSKTPGLFASVGGDGKS